MIKHIFKQLWTLRRKNIWIVSELFLVFVILWYIVDFFSVLGITAATPTGTDITNVYRVVYATHKSDNPKYISYEEDREAPGRNFLRMVERLREHPSVASVSMGEYFYPYCASSTSSTFARDTLRTGCQVLRVSPEYFSMFGVRPYEGGSPEVLALAIQKENSVILSKKAEQAFFGEASGMGGSIMTRSGQDTVYIQVSGICNDMKRHEHTRLQRFALFLFNENSLYDMDEEDIWGDVDICIKIRPDAATGDFPERFKEEMKQSLSIGNFFLEDIIPLSVYRERYLGSANISSTLKYSIALAAFFLINIFLGVLGTFWLRIERRRSEIGLRVAMGSTKQQLMRLMFSEGLCLLFVASLPALIICVNLVATGFMSTRYADFTPLRFLLNTVFTYLLFALAILLSTWYPAKRSASIQPAEALHYE